MIDHCKKYLKGVNSTLDANKTCSCNYTPGEYDIPSLQLPIKDNYVKNMKELGDYLIAGAKGVGNIFISKIKFFNFHILLI